MQRSILMIRIWIPDFCGGFDNWLSWAVKKCFDIWTVPCPKLSTCYYQNTVTGISNKYGTLEHELYFLLLHIYIVLYDILITLIISKTLLPLLDQRISCTFCNRRLWRCWYCQISRYCSFRNFVSQIARLENETIFVLTYH